jgi:hypothetical protein
VSETVTVWAVDLIRDPRADTKGTLFIGESSIGFRPSDAAGTELSIAFADVRKVRRLPGSPVLMVVHDRDGVRERTAFFFVQPPPLQRMMAEPTRVSFIPGMSKRRARRQNASYLGMGNRARRELVAGWETRVRAAIAEAKG